MADGEGFAEEVTRENIRQFEPVLRMPDEGKSASKAPDSDEKEGNDVREGESPRESLPEGLFDGEPFRVRLGRRAAPRTPSRGSEIPGATAPTGVMSFLLGPLGQRDTRQRSGYSRELYIPLHARDANPDFWDWPHAFKADGAYLNRRISLRIHPASGGAPVTDNYRLYHYEDRSEFRLNASPLIEGSSPGDLLVVNRLPDEDESADYEAKIVRSSNPRHSSLLAQCTESVPNNSPKRYRYLPSAVALP